MNKFKSWKYIACAALVLCLCAALVPSVVFATESETVLYVGGTGAGHYATLAAAIEAIPKGSTRAVVVITKPISATNNDTVNHIQLPKHDGELVITSKYGSEDYTNTATINLYQYLHLNGDTTFENIVIAKGANHLYADFHKLHLGEGIKLASGVSYVANQIYLGGDGRFAPAVKDVTFVMDSGVVQYLHGGNRNQATAAGVNITINGGTVITVNAAGEISFAQTHTGDIKVTVNGGTITTLNGVGKGATVKGDVHINMLAEMGGSTKATNVNGTRGTLEGNLYLIGVPAGSAQTGNIQHLNAIPEGGTVSGFKTIVYENGTGTMDTTRYAGFDSILLNNYELTISSGLKDYWNNNNISRVFVSGKSKLTMNFAPTNSVELTIADNVKVGNELIAAPKDTAETAFVMKTSGYKLSYTNGDSATWILNHALGKVGLTLNEALDVNVTCGTLSEGYSIIFTVDGKDIPAGVKENGKFYTSLWPYQMANGKPITVKLMNGEDEVDQQSFTLAQYMDALGTDYAVLKDALLQYCNAAAYYMNQSDPQVSVELADNGLSEYAPTVTTTKTAPNPFKFSVRMSLGDACDMTFVTDNFNPSVYALYVDSKAPGYDGLTVEGNRRSWTVPDIPVLKWNDAIEYKLLDRNKTADTGDIIVKMSPLSYCYLQQNSDVPGLADLVKAMYNYSVAAETVFNAQNSQ